MPQRTPIVRASLLAVLLAGAAGPALHAEVLNRVVLRVNDHIATLYDYEQRKQAFIDEVNRRDQDPAEKRQILSQAGEVVFKDMYDELLLESRADQLAVEITNQQVDRSIEQMKQNYNLKTDQEFRAALAQTGLTEAKLREQFRGNLRMREVLGREVNAKVTLEEDDLRRAYRKDTEAYRAPEQLQLREVVVLEEQVADVARRAQIGQEIRAAVAGGQSLDQAIEAYKTLGQVSGPIDLGWVSKGDLDPALELASWPLAKGAVSEPVAGRGGLHLLHVIDRRESYVKPFSEVAAQIQAQEEDRLYREELAKYMADLQRQALIVADPPAEAAGFRRLLAVPSAADELSGFARQPAEGATKQDEEPAAPQTGLEPPGSPGALPEPAPTSPTPEPAIPPPPL
jgi:parvulin-like peptidyl-prolyl isomerase